MVRCPSDASEDRLASTLPGTMGYSVRVWTTCGTHINVTWTSRARNNFSYLFLTNLAEEWLLLIYAVLYISLYLSPTFKHISLLVLIKLRSSDWRRVSWNKDILNLIANFSRFFLIRSFVHASAGSIKR